jgi:hypothetical protein
MSEATLQADLQRELLKLTSLFSAGDVVICDWTVLDGSSQNAPYAIIDTADTFDVADIVATSSTVWQIPFDLVIRFTDWDTSRLAMRDARATIIAALMKTENYAQASAALAWGLRGISAGTSVEEIYDRYNENTAESLPAFLSQTINLEVEETASG